MVLTMDSGVRRGSFQSTPPPEGEPGELPFDTSTKEGKKVQRKERRFKGRKVRFDGVWRNSAPPRPCAPRRPRTKGKFTNLLRKASRLGLRTLTKNPTAGRKTEPTDASDRFNDERETCGKIRKICPEGVRLVRHTALDPYERPQPGRKTKSTDASNLNIPTFQSQHSNLNIPISTFQSQLSNLNFPISTFQSQHSLLNDPQTICVLQPEVSPALREQL